MASSVVAAPISLTTSDALLPSMLVPSTRKKSLSARPLAATKALPLEIPAVNNCDVRANVPAVVGRTIDILPEKSE